MRTHEPAETDTIPSGLLNRLTQDEPEAWAEFFQRVYPSAISAIESALQAPQTGARKEAVRLVEAYPNDPAGAQFAINLAWDSFRKHFLKKEKPFDEIRTASDFAAWLIGVAYNGWQRGRYRDRQFRRQVALGSACRRHGDGLSSLSLRADPHEGPEVAVDLADFSRALHEELTKFTRYLTDVDRRIIYLSFFEGKTPREIKAIVGASVSKCEEAPRLWMRHLAQRYPFTLDFLADDFGGE